MSRGCGTGKRDTQRLWWKSVKDGDHLEDQDVDVRIILKGTLKKKYGKVWNRSFWLRIRTSGGFCEHGS